MTKIESEKQQEHSPKHQLRNLKYEEQSDLQNLISFLTPHPSMKFQIKTLTLLAMASGTQLCNGSIVFKNTPGAVGRMGCVTT